MLAQLNCQGNQGYIQKAIVESGIFYDPFQDRMRFTKEELLEQGKRFFAFLGVETLEEARALPAEFIRDKNNAFGAFWGTIPDGVYQTDTYWNNMKAGKLLDVPIMTGFTNNEFFTAPQAEDPDALKKEAEEKFGDRAQEYLDLVHAENGLEAAKENGLVSSVELGIRRMCSLLEKAGGQVRGPRW